ncbi:MAG: hypothetical protein JWM80_6585 [Cyanobacteria bacterium RYN_339]|nr:hypothetical protein [Cyanobacteria bacterium RYN_339]
MNSQIRSRLALVAMALAVAGGGYYFANFSRNTITDMETRAVAGDFPAMHIEEGEAEVDDNGRMENHQAQQGILRYVATLRLVPPGKYRAVIVATDGNEAHRQKSELVIGARDASGTWHPASASHLVERLTTTK